MHRLRIKFSRGEPLKYLSHLDLMRLWERALRRAGISPAYSEGFSPHPRISMASPLAVGVTSRAEMMDIFTQSRISPGVFVERIKPQLPDGIEVLEVVPVNPHSPSMQSCLRFAEYILTVHSGMNAEEVEKAIKCLLEKEQLPWHHSRDSSEKYYDLRPLIDHLWLVEKQENAARIGMRLRCDASGTGRPEQVARALGYEGAPVSIERTSLVFS